MRYLASLITGVVLAAGVAVSPAMAQDQDGGHHDNQGHGNGHGQHHDNQGSGQQPHGNSGYGYGYGHDQHHDHHGGGYGGGYGGYGHQGPGGGYGPAPQHMYPGYARYGWPAGYAPHYHPLPPGPMYYRPPPRPGYWAVGARYYDPGYGPTMMVQDYDDYGLLPPPPGYGWRRSRAGDFILVAAATGIITDILLHH